MSADPTWRTAEGLDPATAHFPAIAKLGDERVVILHTGKGYRGIELRCPHQKAIMTLGIMMGASTMVRCPKHNFIFRLTDGKGVNCVGLNLKVYEVRSNGEGLEVFI
jgi:nitrite reductase/ring-hydroxylating ferredoxin subunit